MLAFTHREGRHRSSLVQSEKYLLTCHRYIELNPVRAGMVRRPEEYKWSSYNQNGWGDSGWLTLHEQYLQLGETLEERTYTYRELFKPQLAEEDLHHIRHAAHYCHPVGDDRFKREIESKYGFKFGKMGRGRPRKRRDDELVNI